MAARQDRMEAAEERLGQHVLRFRQKEQAILDRIDRIGRGGTIRTMSVPSVGHATLPLKTSHLALPNIPERIVGRDDIVSIEFLEAGLLAKRSVCRLSGGAGTGFHVGLGLVMTAGHSLPTIAEASDTVAEFDVEEHKLGTPVAAVDFILDPERFYLHDKVFDFAICATAPLDSATRSLDSYGWHILSDRTADISSGVPISIVHHPKGNAKALTVHNAHFVDAGVDRRAEHYCWYSGDTRGGSSGAPVFDPDWSVIAIHQSSVPLRDAEGMLLNHEGKRLIRNGNPVQRLDEVRDIEEVGVHANEGTRADHIVRRLRDTNMDHVGHQAILNELLMLWSAKGAKQIARRAAMTGIASA